MINFTRNIAALTVLLAMTTSTNLDAARRAQAPSCSRFYGRTPCTSCPTVLKNVEKHPTLTPETIVLPCSNDYSQKADSDEVRSLLMSAILHGLFTISTSVDGRYYIADEYKEANDALCNDKKLTDTYRWPPLIETLVALERGQNPNTIDSDGNTPLLTIISKHAIPKHLALFQLRKARRRLIRLLLEHGANPDLKGSGSSTPLEIACMNHDVEAVKLLLAHNTTITEATIAATSSTEIRGMLLAHAAMQFGRCAKNIAHEAYSFLRRQFSFSDPGESPEVPAVAIDTSDNVVPRKQKNLKKLPADRINHISSFLTIKDQKSLAQASRETFDAVIKLPLKELETRIVLPYETTPEKDCAVRSLLARALLNGLLFREPGIFTGTLLRDYLPDNEEPNADGMYEINRKNTDAAHTTIADAQGYSKYSWPPNLGSLVSEHPFKIMLALERGANPNAIVDNEGTTLVLAAAADTGHYDIRRNVIQLLLNYGANPNLANNDGNTPLLAACDLGYVKIVNLLLEHGADPNCVTHDTSPLSPLHKAIRNGSAAIIVKQLLKYGANPNFIASDNTPLAEILKTKILFAITNAYNNRLRLAELTAMIKPLLEYGANPNIPDPQGKSLLSYVTAPEDFDTLKLFLEHGAIVTEKVLNRALHPEVKALLQKHYERQQMPANDYPDSKATVPVDLEAVE